MALDKDWLKKGLADQSGVVCGEGSNVYWTSSNIIAVHNNRDSQRVRKTAGTASCLVLVNGDIFMCSN